MVVGLLRVLRVRREHRLRLLRLTTHQQWRLQQRLAKAQHQRTPHWPPRGRASAAAGGRRPPAAAFGRNRLSNIRIIRRDVGRAID